MSLPLSTIPKPVALFETTLATKMTASATEATLTKGTDKRGNTLSGVFGLTIDEGTASEEFIILTLNGTAGTGALRGIDPQDGTTEVAALKFAHRRGATVKVTNYPIISIIYRLLMGSEGFPNNLDLGTKKMTNMGAPTATTDAATKAYVDAGLAAGAANADEDTPGIAEVAAEAEAQYGFDSNWDISVGAHVQTLSIVAQETTPNALFFRPDGLKMYVLGSQGDDVNEYNLSTAWDVSTAVHSQAFSVAAKELIPTGLWFKTDGKKMYVVGTNSDNVHEYDLSTAWDVSSAAFAQSLSISAQESSALSLVFKPDGLKMWVTGAQGDDITEYNLSTAWDISTAVVGNTLSTAAKETLAYGLFFRPDGKSLYICGSSSRDVHEYSMTTAWDISTGAFVQSLDVEGISLAPTGLFFSPTGHKMYFASSDDGEVHEYNLPRVIVARPGTIMGAIQAGHHFTAADAGSTDSYHIRLNPPLKALRTSQMFCFIANTANTAACELDIDGTGYKAIKKYATGAKTDLVTGDIIASMPVIVAYDGTHFVMLNPGGTMPTTALLSEMATFFGNTDITGAEAEDLTDGGETVLHSHISAQGVVSDLVTDAIANNDVVVTPNFQPKVIVLRYWIQGYTGATSTATFHSRGGVAVYRVSGGAGVLAFNQELGYDTTHSDNPAANTQISTGANLATAPTVSGGSGSGHIELTLTIPTVTSTAFTIRRATTGAGGQNARAKISYEVYG